MDGAPSFTGADALDLLDWKRQIFALYERVRAAADPAVAWEEWCTTRSDLVRGHPQSPIPAWQRERDELLMYPYEPRWRVVARVDDLPATRSDLGASTGETMAFTRIGLARFTLEGVQCELPLLWNDAYGGGVFVPFSDETTGVTTYGGGRYLVDTVKGADLGSDRHARTIVFDFNFAYNPSCSYDPSWACPLAPASSRLPLAVTAGERVG
ncbi:MAG: DUF1684 domain-containing protein [Gaiellales bacterium]